MSRKRLLNKEQELDICTRYSAGIKIKELAKEYHYSEKVIRTCLIRNNVKLRTRQEHCRSIRLHPKMTNAKQLFNSSHYTDGDIDFEFFMEMSQQNCSWCEKPPSNSFSHKSAKTQEWHEQLISNPFIYNGLDRIDNNRGHYKDNVVPSCYVCNRARGLMTTDEFREWINSVYSHQNKIW